MSLTGNLLRRLSGPFNMPLSYYENRLAFSKQFRKSFQINLLVRLLIHFCHNSLAEVQNIPISGRTLAVAMNS
jgi:hypothetical protein